MNLAKAARQSGSFSSLHWASIRCSGQWTSSESQKETTLRECGMRLILSARAEPTKSIFRCVEKATRRSFYCLALGVSRSISEYLVTNFLCPRLRAELKING